MKQDTIKSYDLIHLHPIYIVQGLVTSSRLKKIKGIYAFTCLFCHRLQLNAQSWLPKRRVLSLYIKEGAHQDSFILDPTNIVTTEYCTTARDPDKMALTVAILLSFLLVASAQFPGGVPDIPDVPDLPDVPDVPDVPNVPNVPDIPA